MAVRLRQALRTILLPMRVASELVCCRVLVRELRSLDIEARDFASWVRLEHGTWRDSGTPSENLRLLVGKLLEAADEHYGRLLAASYFDIHRRLCSEHLMSHDEAVAFLSHAFLICDLADIEQLSAAQIARLIERRDTRARFSRQSIGSALRGMGLEPQLDRARVERLYLRDKSLELPSLADSDLATSADVVGEAAQDLGFQGDLREYLGILAPEDAPALFAPYLQILHYQCSIAEYFDHAVTDLYEFSPRGQAADWLFSKYPQALANAGNPFLNNAKSVERLDEQWVRSKRLSERPGASALYSVLSGMEAMGFATRRELARWIRLWLHRIIRLVEPAGVTLPDAVSVAQASKLLKAVAQGNTQTYGVLEQRIVDALASIRHDPNRGWRSRGIGDSANATNVSRRKMGDCDFQNADHRTIEAFEAHGGILTDVYVREHIRTLEKSIEIRLEELSGVADVQEWQASVTFVAHGVAATTLPQEIVLRGLRVSLAAITFRELIAGVPHDVATRGLNEYVFPRLRERRTPEEVRAKTQVILT